MLDEPEGQTGSCGVVRSVGVLRVTSEVWAELVSEEEGSVPGVDSISEGKMSG